MPPRKGKRRKGWKPELKGKSKEKPFGRFQSKGTMRENWGGGEEWERRVRMGGSWEWVGGWKAGKGGVCVCGGCELDKK